MSCNCNDINAFENAIYDALIKEKKENNIYIIYLRQYLNKEYWFFRPIEDLENLDITEYFLTNKQKNIIKKVSKKNAIQKLPRASNS